MRDYNFTAGCDDENRLTSWDRSNGDDQDWTLSLVGDWDSFSENGTAVSRTHNDVHELTAIGANSLTYDVKGNLLTDTDNHTYTWDIDNHLATAVVGSMAARGVEGTHEYEYDALGRRVAKEVSDDSGMTTVVTRTLYINNYQLLPPLSSVGGQVVAEYEKVDAGSMTLARTYVYGEYVDEPLSVHSTLNSQPSTLYYHTNRVFNVVGLTDINDAVIEVYTYTPYGTVDIRDPSNMSTRASSSYGNTYTFTGRRTDQETGLHYFRARYMDSVLGRFINRDSLHYLDGSSLYLAYFAIYGGIDPSGQLSRAGGLPPAGATAVGKVCAVTMLDHGATVPDRWRSEAELAGTLLLNGAATQGQILDFVKRNGCCTLYTIGHRGGPVNEGGTVTFPDIDNPHNPVYILPDSNFEQQLRGAFKASGCKWCAMNIVSCGDKNDPKGPTDRKKMAKNTGCIVCGSVDVHAIGGDQTLGAPRPGQNMFGDPITVKRWKNVCELPPGSAWAYGCRQWQRETYWEFGAPHTISTCVERGYVPMGQTGNL